jgi:hypothetical protein
MITLVTMNATSAAFTGTTTNGANAFTAAASFPTYPTSVNNNSPLFYHRLDEPAGATAAADSSGNGLTGVYGADSATGAAFLTAFDEGSGTTVKDLSGSASPKNLTTTNMTWAAGKSGTAGSFNGTTAYATASGSVVTTSSSFSVAAWVYLTDNTGYRTAVSQDGTTVAGFQLQYNLWQNRWVFLMQATDTTSPAGNLAISTTVPALNTWTHLVGVYDAPNDQMQIWVNGVLEGTNPWAGAWSATGSVVVGAEKYNGARAGFWQGRVDDVRLYTAKLSQIQISELANGITGGPSTSYAFSENSGTTTADLSGNTNKGTFGSGATWTTGKAGKAVALDGTTNAYVSADDPALDTSKSFTVSAWVYLNGASLPTVNMSVMSQPGVNSRAFSLKYDTTHKWSWSLATSDINNPGFDPIYSTADASPSTWTHLVGVYDSGAAAGQQSKLYVNAGTPVVGPHTSVWNATGTLQVGRSFYSGAYVDNFNGNIDDMRTYRRALSAAEVSLLYNGGSGGAPALGHSSLGQPGALQGAQQGQQGTTSAGFTSLGNGYNPVRYANPTTFSLECWFRNNGVAGTMMSFGNVPDSNSGTHDRELFLNSAGNVVFGANSGTANVVQSPGTYFDGNWHHVVATISPTAGMALYLDGTSVNTRNFSTVGNYTGYWRWGGDTATAGTWPSDLYTGQLDEVAVYGTVLSAQQVAWHYHANH